MQINWFVVIAQIINFLILVWLLKQFLYEPILRAIAEREKKIVTQLEEAETLKAEALNEQAEFRKRNEAFDREREELMRAVADEINAERLKLLEGVRTEAGTLRDNLQKSWVESQEQFSREITRKSQEEVFAMVRKTLADLASISLEEQSVHIFVRRLRGLNQEEKSGFVEAFRTDNHPVILKSAYPLPERQQQEIAAAVREILGAKPQFQFELAPELISGIELTSNGYKIAWSISEYLRSFQANLAETMRANPETESDNQQDDGK